jgi:tRNA nucleotidyltransferase (CCA-adding enzyme)
VFVGDIDQDLARRDFTVNAIAYDPVDGHVVDPFGGLADMRNRVLRAVGNPSERFQEDGLRILRGARFVATLDFELEKDTEAAFRGALDTFRKVSPERVREEWLKAMKASAPSRAFEVMRRTGILEVTYPELLEQVGCEQNQWHAYDVWNHTMRVLDESTGDPIERVAALLHDVAKPRTRAKSDKTNDWTFYHHEKVGADMADRWLRDYRFSNSERDLVTGLIRHHLICYSNEWTDAAVRRFIKRVGPDKVDSLLRLGEADALGKGRNVEEELAALRELRGRVDQAIEEGGALTTGDLAIGGNDVIPLLDGGAGPAVGQILRALLEKVIDDPSLNTRDKLMPLAEKLAQEHR